MDEEKLRQYIDANLPIIYIVGYDEVSIMESILNVTGRRKVWEWNLLNGLVNRKEINGKDIEFTEDIMEDYNEISLEESIVMGVRERGFDRKVIVVKDIAAFLDDSKIVSLFKNACVKIENGDLDTVFIFVSPVLNIPKELEKYITILEEGFLSENEIYQRIDQFVSTMNNPVYKGLKKKMANAFKGLSSIEIDTILALGYAQNGENGINEDILELISEQKMQLIKKDGILEMIQVKESIDDIGGLDTLKDWLKKKAKVINNMEKAEDFGVEMPKGVLIAGVPGCGKSLNAKASAKLFNIPLLKLDMGRLMGKYVGESESNMRRAIALSEAIAPCVLWIDELEKAFSGIGGDGGSAEVTTRLFGQFLTWMQDKNSSVFVVATANDIMKLPPELMRKGRFDEIFYVQLPNEEERRKIFEIHIKKRREEDYKDIDIDKLVQKTEGYSGADIEGVVRDAIESAFVRGDSKVETQDFLDAIQSTHSLKEIMGESIKKLQQQYEQRKFKSAS
ncbi:AAA family ATPase [Lachnospira hominis (ex Hitch et al. 2024)]|uniref:Uncharacterized AAA domain-containing protein ycf46 n=1 Tax=Lachnospira intestinalis TaxID=3133158 RepID=A0ABV1GJF0_9FIRM